MSTVSVKMKLSPAQAGKLYMKSLKLEDKLKWAYCKQIGRDSIVGLDSCDKYKQWLNSLGN